MGLLNDAFKKPYLSSYTPFSFPLLPHPIQRMTVSFGEECEEEIWKLAFTGASVERELSLRTQAEATEEGSRLDRLKTDAETRALYRKEEQIQGLSEPKIETGEMKNRVNKITDERNGPWGPPLHPCRWKTGGQRKKWPCFLRMCTSLFQTPSVRVLSYLQSFPLVLVH